jgi:hypothetical protein
MSRLPHFAYTIGSQLAVRSSVLLAGRPLPARKIPGSHLCQTLSRPQDHSAAGMVRSIEESNDLMGNRTCDLLGCILFLSGL